MTLFAQPGDGGGGGLGGAVLAILLLVELAILIVVLAGTWKMFAKAGKPGWASLIPIYNLIVLLEIVGRPIWWILLLLIPCVNLVISILLAIDLARVFGKSPAFAVGILVLGFIFIPILGFGDAKYLGPGAGAAAA